MGKLGDIAKAVGEYMKGRGFNIAHLPYTIKMQEDYSWYRGNTDWHTYRIPNGKRKIKHTRKTLNMAKTACEDWASLIMTEKTKVQLQDDNAQKFIDKFFNEIDLINNSRQLIELTMALGTGAYVSRFNTEQQKIKVDFIHGDLVFPLKWESNKIIDCGFATVGGQRGDTKVTFKFITHTLEDKKGKDGKEYVIREVCIDQEGSIVRDKDLARGLNSSSEYEYEIRTGTDIPFFQIIKPNIVNAYDKTSPFGESVFGQYLDTLRQLDEDYDALFTEINVGKKKIFVKGGLLNFDVKSVKDFEDDEEDSVSAKDPIDYNDTAYYVLGNDWEDGKPPLYVTQWQLYVDQITNALNMNLDVFSKGVGFGNGFYNFNGSIVARTATEIISINHTLYKNLRNHENVIEKALIGLTRAILYLANFFLGTNFNVEQDITVDFDDGILEDKSKKRTELLALYDAGLIDAVEFHAQDRFSGNREQATKFINVMEESGTMRDISSGFGGFGTFGGS